MDGLRVNNKATNNIQNRDYFNVPTYYRHFPVKNLKLAFNLFLFFCIFKQEYFKK